MLFQPALQYLPDPPPSLQPGVPLAVRALTCRPWNIARLSLECAAPLLSASCLLGSPQMFKGATPCNHKTKTNITGGNQPANCGSSKAASPAPKLRPLARRAHPGQGTALESGLYLGQLEHVHYGHCRPQKHLCVGRKTHVALAGLAAASVAPLFYHRVLNF
jgi:hypothetical protein